jgi:hypothetical protein
VEGFNKLLTKFLPKDQTICYMIENKVRIHLELGRATKCGVSEVLPVCV